MGFSANLRRYRLCTIRGQQAIFLQGPFHLRLAKAEYPAHLAVDKRSLDSGRSHLSDEVEVQLAGGPLSFLAGRNLRSELLVQSVGFPGTFARFQARWGFLR